jgi:hypothetical protein
MPCPRRGSNPARNRGSGWRNGGRAEIFAPPDFRPTGIMPHPGPGPLQFRGDDLLELHNVSREFADTFRQFLGSHRVLVQRETECFLVE